MARSRSAMRPSRSASRDLRACSSRSRRVCSARSRLRASWSAAAAGGPAGCASTTRCAPAGGPWLRLRRPGRSRPGTVPAAGGRRLGMFFAPEELGVRAREHDRLPVADLNDLRREPLDEIPIVGDEDERAAVIGKRVEQDVLGVEIEVIGGLVEQQRVGRAGAACARPPAACARRPDSTPARLYTSSPGEQEPAEDVPDHRDHVHRRAVLQRVVHRQRRIEARGLVLREVLHHHLVAFLPGAAVRRFRPRQHPHQRRLAGAVRARRARCGRPARCAG